VSAGLPSSPAATATAATLAAASAVSPPLTAATAETSAGTLRSGIVRAIIRLSILLIFFLRAHRPGTIFLRHHVSSCYGVRRPLPVDPAWNRISTDRRNGDS
jgi:hypothetical protein